MELFLLFADNALHGIIWEFKDAYICENILGKDSEYFGWEINQEWNHQLDGKVLDIAYCLICQIGAANRSYRMYPCLTICNQLDLEKILPAQVPPILLAM